MLRNDFSLSISIFLSQEVTDMTKLQFFLPSKMADAGAFGGGSLGFAGMAGEGAPEKVDFSIRPRGRVLTGTYDEILRSLGDAKPAAALVLFGNAGGENAFMQELNRRLSCPIVGGGAAMDGGRGRRIAGEGDACLFLLEDDAFYIVTETKNIHSHILGRVKVGFDPARPRILRTIDGRDAKAWLDERKNVLGFAEGDFEHLTLSDEMGINAHFSFDGTNVLSGRDLEEEMIARYVLPEEVYPAVFDFYNDRENAIVFGCAGLKGITGELTPVKSLGLYLFGEVCMTEDGAEFGNLMLSKIRFVSK